MDYREQITGWLAADDGAVPAWVAPEPTSGVPVSFHGRTLRGERRQEVLLDALDSDFAGPPILPSLTLSRLKQQTLLSRALWQVEAAPEDASIEWHFASGLAAAAVEELLRTRGVQGIECVFTPKVGAEATKATVAAGDEQVVVSAVWDRVGETAEQLGPRIEALVRRVTALGSSELKWQVPLGHSWRGAPAGLAGIAARPVFGSENGVLPDRGAMYGMDAVLPGCRVEVSVLARGPVLGRRNPMQRCDVAVIGAGPQTEAVVDAVFEALVDEFAPLSVAVRDREVPWMRSRTGWPAPAGTRVWWSDQLLRVDPARVPTGLHAVRSGAGTELAPHPDVSGEELAAAWVEFYRAHRFESQAVASPVAAAVRAARLAEEQDPTGRGPDGARIRKHHHLVVYATFDRPSGSYVELAERLSRMASLFDGATSTHEWRSAGEEGWVPWEGDAQARAGIVQAHAESLERGRVELWHGVLTSISFDASPLRVELMLDDGQTFVMPRHPGLWCCFDLTMSNGAPLPESFVSAAVEALVVGLEPMEVTVSTGDLNAVADRGGWQIGVGYGLWLRDDIAEFGDLPEGVTGERLKNGTLLSVDPSWDDRRVADVMAEVRERYGLDQLPH